MLSFYGTSKHTYQESHFVWPEFGIQLASVEKITRAQVDNTFPINLHEIIEALIDNTDYQNAFNLWKQKLNKYEEFDENHPYVQCLL